MVAAQVATPADVLGIWSWDPGVLIGLVLAAVLYAVGLGRSARGRLGLFPWWRPAFFYAGLLVIAVALVSPLDALAHELFSAHMVQHVLLSTVAPPLVLLGAPFLPLLRGLPRALRRRVVAPLAHNAMVRRTLTAVTQPLAAWLLYTGLFWAWHVPVLYDLAVRHTAVHILQHMVFFGTVLLFWWNVVDPIPLRAHLRHPVRILYLFVTTIPNSALSAYLALSTTPWFASYLDTTRVWGLAPLEDQSLGGLIMWVPGGLLYLLAISGVFFSMPEARDERAREQGA
ncbi:MAG: cytochrome c oxidase assembly protein [Dehalococcoidia bacterium]|nr:cytochrome c oxidase assembly protein [Dehalococcoidia bacterium]